MIGRLFGNARMHFQTHRLFPGHPGIKKQEHDSLPLNLFMLRILANDPYLALSLNDFALLTDRLD